MEEWLMRFYRGDQYSLGTDVEDILFTLHLHSAYVVEILEKPN